MKRLIRFLELWLGEDCTDCMLAMKQLKEFAACRSDDAELVQFELTISKKPGTGGKVHEYHLSPKK